MFGSFFASVSQFVRWNRRTIGTITAVICLACITTSFGSRNAATVTVVVAADTLAAGVTLSESNIVTREIPEEYLPHAAIREPDVVYGRVLAGGATQGSVLTQADVMAVSEDTGERLVPFRISDSDLIALVQVGDHIDVIGSGMDGEPQRLASGVRVAALPQDPNGSGSGGLIVVATDETTARRLSSASTNMQMSFVLV